MKLLCQRCLTGNVSLFFLCLYVFRHHGSLSTFSCLRPPPVTSPPSSPPSCLFLHLSSFHLPFFLPSAYGESSASSYNMAGEKGPTKRSAMDIKRLASLIQRGAGRLLVIDSRTFSEYNASHVQGAINVCCSKLVKRRLQQDKVSVTELLQPNGKVKVSQA